MSTWRITENNKTRTIWFRFNPRNKEQAIAWIQLSHVIDGTWAIAYWHEPKTDISKIFKYDTKKRAMQFVKELKGMLG